MYKVLVSACLMGRKVRYDGGAKTSEHPVLERWRAERRLVPHCPEIAGGLPVPRPPAEIAGAAGAEAVLDGAAAIVTPEGADVTDHFVAGARAALETARSQGVRLAVLKDGSPSCGSRAVYDGSFSGAKVPGQGVTSYLLSDSGIPVFTEEELDAADSFLKDLEAREPEVPFL
ncbi:DUF523 domain-containing protein [Nocardiopsis halophila]|uniref:DUF523 domain-containing protein n=1 Tax=Nocardiopsis halophila TaxID=141692 RepID=UPI0003464C11|nr:DUF523 domain-containing protein [Nocardiopsis halophila]